MLVIKETQGFLVLQSSAGQPLAAAQTPCNEKAKEGRLSSRVKDKISGFKDWSDEEQSE